MKWRYSFSPSNISNYSYEGQKKFCITGNVPTSNGVTVQDNTMRATAELVLNNQGGFGLMCDQLFDTNKQIYISFGDCCGCESIENPTFWEGNLGAIEPAYKLGDIIEVEHLNDPIIVKDQKDVSVVESDWVSFSNGYAGHISAFKSVKWNGGFGDFHNYEKEGELAYLDSLPHDKSVSLYSTKRMQRNGPPQKEHSLGFGLASQEQRYQTQYMDAVPLVANLGLVFLRGIVI